MSKMYFVVEVLDKAKTFILKNFADVSSSWPLSWFYIFCLLQICSNCSDFYFLSSEEMAELLADDRLNANREELTYSALISWTSVNSQRVEHFPKLLKLIRFGNSSLK